MTKSNQKVIFVQNKAFNYNNKTLYFVFNVLKHTLSILWCSSFEKYVIIPDQPDLILHQTMHTNKYTHKHKIVLIHTCTLYQTHTENQFYIRLAIKLK